VPVKSMRSKIAKIVSSNSHVDYVARVIDKLDAEAPPSSSDYGFAQFVSIPHSGDEVIGVIYNSALINPEYGKFGPRLSPAPELAVLSPDYLNEQGNLLGILLLGWRDLTENVVHQTVPRRVVPVNQEVYALPEQDVLGFHKDPDGRLQLHYYSQVITHAGAFGVPLMEAIIEQLDPACAPEEQQRLRVLKQALVWQRTVGGMRL
jgi:hypothetical protein